MRRNFTTLLMCMFFTGSIFAQSIMNASFENWTVKTMYENPDIFTSTNLQSYFTVSTGNVTKTTDKHHGLYAAKLQTVAGSGGNIFGGLFIGTPGQGGITGGHPFAQRPTSLKGYAKFNIQPNDTANIVIIMKKAGAIIGVASTKFHGNQSNYAQFTANFTWYVPVEMPDSMGAILSSSVTSGAAVPGSTLYLDSLSFAGATLAFPNGDFENWSALSYEEPDNWFTINFIGAMTGHYSATKTLDHHGVGNYGIKIETVLVPNGSGNDTIGIITNGRIDNTGSHGGMQVTQNPMKISGYYKYFPNGADSALAGISVFGSNAGQVIALDSNMIKLPAASSYTYFEVNMNYNGAQIADTVNIAFASSNIDKTGHYIGVGSLLYIDDLQISYYPVSVEKNPIGNSMLKVYPNPAKNYISLDLGQGYKNEKNLKIFDSRGQLVFEKNILENSSTIDVSGFSNGMYFYKMDSESGKFIINK